jgi:hypothetical protein
MGEWEKLRGCERGRKGEWVNDGILTITLKPNQ